MIIKDNLQSALSSAIEQYTSEAKKRTKDAWQYDNVDIEYAVRKYLYFLYESNRLTYAIFNRTLSIEKPIVARNKSHAAILKIIEPKYNFTVKPRVKDYIAKILFSFSFKCYKRLTRTSIQPSIKNKIIFFAIHDKFIRYLTPIFEQVKNEAIWAADYDTNIAQIKIAKSKLLPYALGKHLVEFHPLIRFYSYAKQLLTAATPQCIVLPEGNSPRYEILNLIAKQMEIPCYCIQQGWSPVIHSGFRDMHYTNMMLWGEQFKKALIPYNPDQLFTITGSHVITKAPLKAVEPKKPPTICFFLQAVTSILPQEAFDAFNQLILNTAESLPQCTVGVREHPGHPIAPEMLAKLNHYSNVKLLPSEKYNLDHVLGETDLAVSIYSTVILESLCKGITPLIVNISALDKYIPDHALEGLLLKADNIDGALVKIVNFTQQHITNLSPADYAKKVEGFFTGTAGDATAKIVNVIKGQS